VDFGVGGYCFEEAEVAKGRYLTCRENGVGGVALFRLSGKENRTVTETQTENEARSGTESVCGYAGYGRVR
jgi:hypothetical protein